MAAKPWLRPSSVPFPTVWRRFERCDKQDPQRIRKFRVQDVDDNPALHDAVIDHMTEHFLSDEPMCKSLNYKEDVESVVESQAIWRSLFDQRVVLVCFEENEDGTLVKDPNNQDTPKIIGCNMTYVHCKGDPKLKINGKKLSIICDAVLNYVEKSMDYFSYYDVDCYLHAFGLSVSPCCRGMGVATEILKARNDLGLKLGIKATVTAFTAIESQRTAARCQYEVLVEKTYQEIAEHDSRLAFPGIRTKSLKIMGRTLDEALS